MNEKGAVSPRLLASILIAIAIVAAYYLYQTRSSLRRSASVLAFLRDPRSRQSWTIEGGQRCGDAPFLLPTGGYVGYLWGDSFRPGHHHQGIDVFGGGQGNQTPVVAAYPGYLTRLPEWKSSLIIRIPQDPLQPGRQIWIYYTHMADRDGNSFINADFPAGTAEEYVEAGRLLGYQGNYSGDPLKPTGIHLHFSIVLDDGHGKFRNELDIDNTLDPSPYIGLPFNAKMSQGEVPVCSLESQGG